MNGRFIEFDRCSRCGASRIVPPFGSTAEAPVPQPTCACFGENENPDLEADKNATFDSGVIDAQIHLANELSEGLDTIQAVLLLGSRLGDLNEAALKGKSPLVLHCLLKIAALARSHNQRDAP